MDVKEAVQKAKAHVFDLFKDEGIEYMGLEEVEFDDEEQHWNITIGFSRPWDQPKSMAAALGQEPLKRSFKVVRINDASGEILSIKDRTLAIAR